jgi:hypothetical protein
VAYGKPGHSTLAKFQPPNGRPGTRPPPDLGAWSPFLVLCDSERMVRLDLSKSSGLKLFG